MTLIIARTVPQQLAARINQIFAIIGVPKTENDFETAIDKRLVGYMCITLIEPLLGEIPLMCAVFPTTESRTIFARLEFRKNVNE